MRRAPGIKWMALFHRCYSWGLLEPDTRLSRTGMIIPTGTDIFDCHQILSSEVVASILISGSHAASGATKTCLCHGMGAISPLLTLCEGNPSVTDGFPTKKVSKFITLKISLLLAWTSSWPNSDVRHHDAHFDVIVTKPTTLWNHPISGVLVCRGFFLLRIWNFMIYQLRAYGDPCLLNAASVYIFISLRCSIPRPSIGHMALAAITGTIILVPYLQSLQSFWR